MDATKIVGGGSAGALIGVLVTYLSGRFHWGLTADDGAIITAAAAAAGAFVWHNGLLGIFRTLLHGTAAAVKGSTPSSSS